jgi:hypothetical protein
LAGIAPIDVIHALSHGSVPMPVWHLAPHERWSLLRDTLLGHVQLRGGMRTRDLPLDPTARELVRTALAVQACEYEVGGTVPARFGDWLYLFSTLIEPSLAHGTDESDRLAHDAVRQCILELRRALGLSDVSFADSCSIHHRLLGVLGLSRQEWQRLDASEGPCDHARWAARVGARVCAAWRTPSRRSLQAKGADVRSWAIVAIGAQSHQHELVDWLAAQRRVIATLKVVDVQQYLHRARFHWAMRGASVWCGHALAFARDLIAMSDGGLLLSDSDALVSLIFPADTAPPRAMLDEVAKAWSSVDSFVERFPRLAPYHPGQSGRAGDVRESLSSLPRLSLRFSAPASLLDLCVARVCPDTAADVVVGWNPPVGTPDASTTPDARQSVIPKVPCNFVSGDDACVSSAPPWHGERRATHPQSYGWTALCWSLCGTTMRTHWHHGICAELKRDDYSMMDVQYGGWLSQLGLKDESLVFIKLDGDGVGTRFQETSVPSRPLVGLALGRLVLARLIAATRRVIEAHDARSLPRYLPVDLVYVGGDDIFVCVPGCYVAPFLQGFGGPVRAAHSTPWRSVPFSYIAISLPHRSQLAVQGRHSDSTKIHAASLAAAQALSPGLRELVKRRRHDDSTLAELNARVAHLGYRCAFSDAPAGTGVVHGVSLRLVAVDGAGDRAGAS